MYRLGPYLAGAYLFSVPAFAYSEHLGLLMIPQITGAALLAYALWDSVKDLRVNIPLEIWLYGMLGIWAAITFIVFSETSYSGFLSLGSFIKVVLATLACAQLIKNENDLCIALKIFVYSILLIYFQNMNDLRYLRIADEISETDRFAGTLANANTAAIFSLAVIWASIYLLVRSNNKFRAWLFLLPPIGIALMIIYYSGSKKGLLGVGLFTVFLVRLFFVRRDSYLPRKILIILVSLLLIIITAYFIYTSPFFNRVEQAIQGESISDTKRLLLVKEALEVWLMNLKTIIVGVGYDNFRMFSAWQDYSHSTPFELLANTGIIGFSLFMGFLVLLFRNYIKLYRYANKTEEKSKFLLVIAFLSIYTFFMLASVLHESRELLPIMGCISASGQYRLRALSASSGID